MQTSFDIVVIGAGSAGLTAAVGFSRAGKKVLMIEREHLGGECTNSGCVPSKALLHHAKAYYQATQVAGENTKTAAYRAHAFSYVRERVTAILAEETPDVFEKQGISVVMGEAEFIASRQVRVGTVVYEYKIAIIATGSSPRQLSVPGLDQSQVLTNQNIFALEAIPAQMLIIGAGPIGLELGQALAMLGSQVTIATTDTEFARLEDEAIRPILQAKCEALGIRILTRAFITAVEGGEVTFDRRDGDTILESLRVPFDKILVAIGRVPNLPQGLEKADIEASDVGIVVDSQYRTTNRHVYAIGDVSQRLKFTHTADDTARQVVARVLSRGLLRVSQRKAVPKVMYTLPEVAQVGLSWHGACVQYGENTLMRIEVPFTKSDRAKTDDDTSGLLVVIVRRFSGRVLGAHIIGPVAGEILALFTLAIDSNISLWRLRSLIYAYPTYALIVKKAGDIFFARQLADLKRDVLSTVTRHVPKVIALVFWGVLIIAFQQYRITNDLSYIEVLLSLVDFFTSTIWGPLLYMMLYAVRPLVLFPATLLTVLSGTLFGLWWGLAYTVLGANASAHVAYGVGQFFGKDMKLENSVLGGWVEALRARPFEAILFMRLFYVPFDLANYGAGILKIKWPAYFWATVIGTLPGSLTFVALGASLDLAQFRSDGLSVDVFNVWYLGLSIVIFVTSLLLVKILKRK
jgi:pyruvate/2-oxoglutarate dehydrogenase complex dihydrolipoamide dehydrogenase (E3) component/uncharacterized membrane protein YdjX (TVP38/TMEM64 family)